MKTLTEFAGALIRNAHKAVAEASRSLPKEAAAPAEAKPAEPAATPAPEAPAADAAAAPAAEAKPAEAKPAEAKPAEAKPAEAPAAEAKPAAPAEPQESEAVKAALDEAVAKATGLSGDRLARIREALKAVGKRADDVRLVRVFSSEEPVPGSKKVGEFQFIVEYMPASMKQVMTAPDRDKGGRRGPPRPGQGNNAANTTGGFSMDAVKADRQNERRGSGGRPGGGRGGPGGRGPGGGGRPAGGGGRRGQ